MPGLARFIIMSRRSEADGRPALDGRSKALHRYSERVARARLWLSDYRVVDQQWDEFTGRAAINWTPKLDFTDQTLVYGSYAHGYKAGGANPPGAILLTFGQQAMWPIPSSADFQAGIHRCVRAWQQEHAAGWRAHAEWQAHSITITRIIRFPESWIAPRST